MAGLAQTADPSGELRVDLACGERRVFRIDKERRAQAVNRADGGTDAGAIAEREQVQRTRHTVGVRGDEHGGLIGIVVGRVERHHMVGGEPEAGELARLVNDARRAHTAGQTLLALRHVRGVDVVEIAMHVLHNGLVDARGLVGLVFLLAVAYPYHGDVRHRSRGEGRQHQIASFSHTRYFSMRRVQFASIATLS